MKFFLFLLPDFFKSPSYLPDNVIFVCNNCRAREIIMPSESIEDMMSICDRILVMFNGKIVAEFDCNDFNEKNIFANARLCGGKL